MLERLERLKRRYGATVVNEQLRRLSRRVENRRRRIAELRAQQEELERKIRWLLSEIDGLNKGYYLVASELVERIEREHPEAWSPTAVLGYRIWALKSDGLHGVWVKWETPELTATCGRRPPDEVPHTDGCSCGIYAAKDLHELMSDFVGSQIEGFAAGLVALSGKVVEHQYGYRAAHARVVALAVSGASNTVLTDDAELIAAIFADPSVIRGFPERAERSWEQVHDEIEQYLTERARRSVWISADANE